MKKKRTHKTKTENQNIKWNKVKPKMIEKNTHRETHKQMMNSEHDTKWLSFFKENFIHTVINGPNKNAYTEMICAFFQIFFTYIWRNRLNCICVCMSWEDVDVDVPVIDLWYVFFSFDTIIMNAYFSHSFIFFFSSDANKCLNWKLH